MKSEYQKLNNSFKNKLVYRLGSEAGFFSEYNNMILAILYCLKHKIRFELFSKNANFGTNKGWLDYFEPFCEENNQNWHKEYNFRQPIYQINFLQKKLTHFYKIFFNTKYLTYELWNEFHVKSFEYEQFDIKDLDFNGDLLSASKKIIDITWRYNKKTQIEVNALIESLNLPIEYNGLHIRGGDKFIEWEKLEVEKYMNIVSKKSANKSVFVLTDDFRIIVELKENYPTYSFYTLCNESERGYFHTDFEKVSNTQKRNDLIKLFASIDILASSQLFVGTYSSNPGMYLGMRMSNDKVKCVDLDNWCIW